MTSRCYRGAVERAFPVGFNPLAHPICLSQPRWLASGTREERVAAHAPFVFLLVDLLAPNCVVSASGPGSLFAATCQGTDELARRCQCIRVDSGNDLDLDAGAARDSYPVSGLVTVRSRVDTAAATFADGAIDLLIVDEASMRDTIIEGWLSRLSAKGVVLLQGPSATFRRLGERFPTLHFAHGDGLGIVFVGGEVSPLLGRFLDSADRHWEEHRDLFRSLGEAASNWTRSPRADDDLRTTLNERERLLNDLRWEVETQAQTIDRLERSVDRTEHEYRAVLASRAWRYTAPVRRVVIAIRTALRAVVRRRVLFDLEPANDIQSIVGEEYDWKSVGLDPFFHARPRARMPSGWVLFSTWVDYDPADLAAPRVYFDPGDGYSEDSSFSFARGAEGAYRALVHLSPGTRSFRFDPLAAPGRFRIREFSCREIGGLEGVARLAWPHLATSLRSPRLFLSRVRRVLQSLRTGGVRGVWRDLQPGSASLPEQYTDWVQRFDTLVSPGVEDVEKRLAGLRATPTLSVAMPVYNTDLRWLRRAIQSVLDQWYPHWELCIADDASSDPAVRELLDEMAGRDARIKVEYRETRGNISAASNTALAMATGEFVALLDHDDELRPHALLSIAEEIDRHPGAELLYSDEDKIDRHGVRFDPYFKPDWNPDLFYSQNYVNHLAVCRRSRLLEVGGFREGYEGAQDYDLFLRLVSRVRPEDIRHVPLVLYHWRAAAGSTGLDGRAKDYAHDAARRALRWHFEHDTKQDVRVEPAYDGSFHHRVVWPLPDQKPLVSVVIPTRDRAELLRKAVKGCFAGVDYPAVEVLVVDNESEEAETLELLSSLRDDPRIHVISYPGPFNFSAINNVAISESKGELIALLNNDVEPLSGGWLREMVSQAMRPEIGAVGAKLYYPNDKIQHAGVVIGIGGVAGHAHKHHQRGTYGHGGRARVVQNFSAVTGACLMTRRDVLDEVGLLDEEHLAVAFNDIDLCLRIRARGYRIVWTPYAEFYHYESASRGDDLAGEKLKRFHREIDVMFQRWATQRALDPYYNPNLTLDREDFSLAFPPRIDRAGRPTR